MNFDYNEEQQLLADSVRRFLARDYDFEARRRIVASREGYSAQVWAAFAQMGLTGLPFAAEHGGFGGGPVTIVVLTVAGFFAPAAVLSAVTPTVKPPIVVSSG